MKHFLCVRLNITDSTGNLFHHDMCEATHWNTRCSRAATTYAEVDTRQLLQLGVDRWTHSFAVTTAARRVRYAWPLCDYAHPFLSSVPCWTSRRLMHSEGCNDFDVRDRSASSAFHSHSDASCSKVRCFFAKTKQTTLLIIDLVFSRMKFGKIYRSLPPLPWICAPFVLQVGVR